MVEQAEQQPIVPASPGLQPAKSAMARRTLLIWLLGIVLAEVVASGITWQQFIQTLQATLSPQVTPVAYPPHNQPPVLTDPLQDNSKGNNWKVDDPRIGNCKFIDRAYNISTDNLTWCPARATDFKNFIYEVQMTIVKGDEGGIAFRIDPRNEALFYYFAINQDGSYSVHNFTARNDVVLAQGLSRAIHPGLNQTNLVAAVVHGQVIELYVNLQRVAVVGSSTLTHGQIGVIVAGDSHHPTEVIFQNAKVWKL